MKIPMNEICAFTNSTPSCRNFIEGERVLNANHIIFCGKSSVDENCANFLAFCSQTSSMRSNPHEIAGSISNTGKILSIKCSCKAGLSKKCKHSVAVLLHLNRLDVMDLDLISSTDTKCLWKVPYSKSIEKYAPCPLFSHECFNSKKNKEYSVELNKEDLQKIDDLLLNENQTSALYKHKSGRHEPQVIIDNTNKIDSKIIEKIFSIQPSDIMQKLSQTGPDEPSKQCCKEILKSLQENSQTPTRAAYKNFMKANVVEVGLVVPEINTWLGYSPDGIIIDENDKPSKLIEIKCPFAGKTKTVQNILDSLDFLEKNYTLKTKHRYYAQIQLGMAILNLKETDFIVYTLHSMILFCNNSFI